MKTKPPKVFRAGGWGGLAGEGGARGGEGGGLCIGTQMCTLSMDDFQNPNFKNINQAEHISNSIPET